MQHDAQKLKPFGRGLNRRDFVKRAGLLALATPFTPHLIGSAARASGPKRGGRFKLGLGHGSTTDSLDPATFGNGFTINLSGAFGNNLFEVDNSGALINELVERYDVSKDAKTWVFELRRGVEFHNGRELTAADVISSLNHHRGAGAKSVAKSLLDPIDKIRKSGKHEVTFSLKAGNADFPFILSDYHFVIMPDDNGAMDWKSGVGTGGYVIRNFSPGAHCAMRRNANYWKFGRAHFDEVEMLSLIDTATRQNAVMNQEVDAIDRVDPQTVHLLARNPAIQILETTGTLHYTFSVRVDTPPFDSYNVRMACKLAVDRDALLTKVLAGHGELGNDHPISVSNRYHNSDLPQRGYDPDKARFHLKKAGLENLKLDLSTSDAAFTGAVDAALLIRNSAARAGIDINVVREPRDGYWTDVWNRKPWCAGFWGGRPTEDWMFTLAYVAESDWNETAWRATPAAQRFNDLVVAARSELDPKKRRTMYYECQTLVNDDGGAIIPMFANHVMALNRKVAHEPQVGGNWELDGARAIERWWFA